MFGVGTDYCLLLVSRYREELHRVEDKHEAMARALRRAGPAVLASGLHRDRRDARAAARRHRLDERARPGVGDRRRAPSLLAGLTLLPALLTIAGRRGFWPRGRRSPMRPDVDLGPAQGAVAALRRPRAPAARARARRDGGAVRASSRSACSPTRRTTRSAASSRRTSRASTASTCSAQSFPQGALGADDDPRAARRRGRDRRRLAAVRARVEGVDGVAPSAGRSAPRTARSRKVDVTFERRPRTRRRRSRASTRCASASSDLPGGATALVGAGQRRAGGLQRRRRARPRA